MYTVNAVYGASIKSEEVKLNDHLISEVEFSFVILAGQHSMPWNWRWLLWRKELIVLSFHYSYLQAPMEWQLLNQQALNLFSKGFAIQIWCPKSHHSISNCFDLDIFFFVSTLFSIVKLFWSIYSFCLHDVFWLFKFKAAMKE